MKTKQTLNTRIGRSSYLLPDRQIQWWARIFEYSNKMALKYYLYSYLFHFPSKNIFGLSFVHFRTTQYIQIFASKISKFGINLNICSEPYSNNCLWFFNEKSISRYNLWIKNIQYNILFSESMSEPFKKTSLISDEYEYLNILIKLPSTIICIRIHAIFVVQIYLDIFLVNMWHPNIFRYLFGTYFGI